MSSGHKLRNAWIVAGLYLAVMVESTTLGVLFHATLAEMIDHSQMKVDERSPPAVIILTFVIVSLIGYTLTIPCLCYAVQCHSPSALIPYLVWRKLFSLIILVIVIWQAFIRSSRPALFRSAFYDHQLPVAIGEIIIGAIFFAIAMRAHREFTRRRTERDKTPENDVFG